MDKSYFINNKIKRITIILVIITVIIMVYLSLNQFSSKTGTICLVRGTIGIPCPSCGMTRAIKEFFSGNLTGAIKFHPLFWLPFAVSVIIYLDSKLLKKVLIVAIALLLSIYIFRMVKYFPDIEPMNKNEKSIIKIFIQ